MRKLYKLMLTALAATATLSASASTIRIHVDDPATVKITVGQMWYTPEEKEVVAGWNEFELTSYYETVTVVGKDPYMLDKVLDEAGNEQYISYDGSWSKSGSSDNDVYSYNIQVKNLNETRTSSCTVNIDDISLVKVERSGTNTEVELVNGENTVYFDPDVEKYLKIKPAEYGQAIYEVLLNGELVTGSYEEYQATLTQDCVVDITAAMPEGEVTVTFVYGEGAEGSIIKPTVNYTEVEDFDGTSFKAPIGAKVGWSGNPAYCIDGLKINGVDDYWRGPETTNINEVIKRDMTVEVEAHKYAEYEVTVKCTDPSHFKLYVGETWNNTPVELTGTENVIMVNEHIGKLSWTVNPTCKIHSVTKDGEPVEYTSTTIDHDGIVVEFETSATVLDLSAILYFENLDGANYGKSITGSDEDKTVFSSLYDQTVFEGYNKFKFADVYNPLDFSYYGYDYSKGGYQYGNVYVNDVYVARDGEYAYNTMVNLEDGDVVKVFIGAEPTVFHVQIEADAENTDKYQVVRDIIKEVPAEAFEGFDTFQNTRMEIKPLEDSLLEVTVNGEAVEKNEDGNFVFTVVPVAAEEGGDVAREAGVTNVKVEFLGSGIDMIEAADGAKAVYNLQGIKVADSLENLPAGLYITNGKKVLVK